MDINAIMLCALWFVGSLPGLLYGFSEYSKAIKIIRERYPEHYLKLGCPSELVGKGIRGDALRAQWLIVKLIFVMPKEMPPDAEVMVRMKRMQWMGRLWNLTGLPFALYALMDAM